ncbi:uncharacterized protein LOC132701435 [Cylas formicarius]|uniref:uncharacterized protein LOC132701435 n=1 Tax=Cylas formicarius TaxID=197179 RepID=UPI0029588D6A|nr:uncharacterized protein LOC132701435 [Cylas formicarius]
MADSKTLYKNGVWVWDDYSNGIVFISKDLAHRLPSKSSRCSAAAVSYSGKKQNDFEMQTMETVDIYAQAKFRKLYQRRVNAEEPSVVTLQDVKDVAIFTTKVEDLTFKFISYFHTVAVDCFLRSLIIYFQYYFQVWNKLQAKRIESSRKLRQPTVVELENEIRDNMSDLRAMVARDYAAILLGLGDANAFHHMSNQENISLAEQDRTLFEMFIPMATKVVWIALFRKNLTLVEKELNRMLRTNWFNPVQNVSTQHFTPTTQEERILTGVTLTSKKKLLHRSPAIQELTLVDHDYRMLSIGIKDVEPIIPENDERTRYLEIAYTAPEELLVDLNVGVGVLGVERRYLDSMLKPREISTTVKRTSIMRVADFNMPPRSRKLAGVASLSRNQPKYQETKCSHDARSTQCKMWIKYLKASAAGLKSEVTTITSFLTAKTPTIASKSSKQIVRP